MPHRGLVLGALCCVLQLVTLGCGGARAVEFDEDLRAERGSKEDGADRCQARGGRDTRVREDRPMQWPEAALPDRFSARLAGIASATNLLPLLHRREALAVRPHEDADRRLTLLSLNARINRHIMLALTDASSTAARIRCERSRAQELADSLERNKDRRETRQTLGAIIAGAATNVLTGIMSLADAAVTGGALGIAGGLGQAAIKGFREEETITVELWHPENYLKEIWDGPQSARLFPDSVWRFLTRPDPETRRSLREETIHQWRRGRDLRKDNDTSLRERYAVLFGEGGRYTLSQLRARAAMLELLATSIELMHQDLDLLLRELLDEAGELEEARAVQSVLPRTEQTEQKQG